MLLNGKSWNLNVDPKSVFQFPSIHHNSYTYFVMVDRIDVLNKIIFEVEDSELEKCIGSKIKDLNVVGGGSYTTS